MLVFGSTLRDQPIMSLQTGAELARTDQPIIDPYRLIIRAYKLQGQLLEEPDNSYLRLEDIREISQMGMIIDSADEIVLGTDIIKLHELIKLEFELLGLKVVDQAGHNLGKVVDYSIDMNTFMIYQLVVKRPLLKSFNDPELIIDRAKIVELDNQKVIVKEEVESNQDSPLIKNTDFVNPFRKEAKKPANSIESE